MRQSAESVDFSANGITATGIKALSQVLPANTFLKTLNLSGNSIGDEGAAVRISHDACVWCLEDAFISLFVSLFCFDWISSHQTSEDPKRLPLVY